MIEFNSKSFEEAIAGELPVVVDFWASWCMPCKLFAPVLEEISDELDGKAVFGKLNIDDFDDVAMRYSITSIPTVIVFKGGEEAERMIGVKAKEAALEIIGRHI